MDMDMDIGYEGKGRIKDKIQIWGLSTWMDMRQPPLFRIYPESGHTSPAPTLFPDPNTLNSPSLTWTIARAP